MYINFTNNNNKLFKNIFFLILIINFKNIYLLYLFDFYYVLRNQPPCKVEMNPTVSLF